MKKVLATGEEFLERMQGRKVLVLGDLMIDQYLWGDVSRISPEAPVPIVGVQKETFRLGGAANVANNLVSLGGKAEAAGLVGDDQMGRWILRDLKKRNIGTRAILTSRERPTTVKTRVIAHNQQVVRFDREVVGPLAREDEENLLGAVRSLLADCEAIIISDYAKGVITPGVIKKTVEMAKKAKLPVAVDPKVSHFALYREVTVLTPNLFEASAGAGRIIKTMEDLIRAGKDIVKKLDCEHLIITRGDQGMTVFSKGGGFQHLPAVSREVFDVTGAGDTVVATVALGLAAGLLIGESAWMANLAAGVVVGEVGTVPITRAQLKTRIRELRDQG